ncbi:DUF3096 domain-containing protein [Chloroflexota bacterium]
MKISWVGIISIVAGILVIIFPNLISYSIGIALIVMGIIRVIGKTRGKEE